MLPVVRSDRMAPGAIARVAQALRNPCQQINDFRSGLLKVAVTCNENGELVRKAGIMGVVEHGGTVYPGDAIRVKLPPEPHVPLDRV